MLVHKVGRDVSVLNDQTEVPGIGFLPVNAFVLHAAEPVVVDTGLGTPGTGFMDALESVIDPVAVRWIWLTHPDRDHTGSLFELLEAAPDARVVTTFIGAGIMSTENPLPMDRVHLLNPGQSLDVGDRTLTAFRPPLFDSPATTGFIDDRTGVCFSSDFCGAPLLTAELASTDDVSLVPHDDLAAGQRLWATIDSPWIHDVDPARFAASLGTIRAMDPSVILSTHLPPARDMVSTFLQTLADVPSSPAYVGPDQRALEQMLASFDPTPEPV